jgi:hypothetical protein
METLNAEPGPDDRARQADVDHQINALERALRVRAAAPLVGSNALQLRYPLPPQAISAN